MSSRKIEMLSGGPSNSIFSQQASIKQPNGSGVRMLRMLFNK